MKVKELIQNLQATEDMEKEVCIDINGIRYTLQDRLLGYDIIAWKPLPAPYQPKGE